MMRPLLRGRSCMRRLASSDLSFRGLAVLLLPSFLLGLGATVNSKPALRSRIPPDYLTDLPHGSCAPVLRWGMRWQHMAPQVRQQRMHVEREERDWMFAFNINISLTSLFE